MNYIYIFVRQDISLPQQVVQAGHAILEMHRTYNGFLREHPSFVVFGVRNEQKLKDVILKLVRHGSIQFTAFQEPDIGNEYTALATVPVTGADRQFFRNYKLLDGTTTV